SSKSYNFVCPRCVHLGQVEYNSHMNKILTLEIKRMVYGFRDPDVLGPVNFKTTDDVLQAIVFDTSSGLKLVDSIVELDVREEKVLGQALRRLKGYAKKRSPGLTETNVPVKTTYCGAFRR